MTPRSGRGFYMKCMFTLLLFLITPVSISTAGYFLSDRRGNWQTADRSSSGLLPNPSEGVDALITIYAARTLCIGAEYLPFIRGLS